MYFVCGWQNSFSVSRCRKTVCGKLTCLGKITFLSKACKFQKHSMTLMKGYRNHQPAKLVPTKLVSENWKSGNYSVGHKHNKIVAHKNLRGKIRWRIGSREETRISNRKSAPTPVSGLLLCRISRRSQSSH